MKWSVKRLFNSKFDLAESIKIEKKIFGFDLKKKILYFRPFYVQFPTQGIPGLEFFTIAKLTQRNNNLPTKKKLAFWRHI